MKMLLWKTVRRLKQYQIRLQKSPCIEYVIFMHNYKISIMGFIDKCNRILNYATVISIQ